VQLAFHDAKVSRRYSGGRRASLPQTRSRAARGGTGERGIGAEECNLAVALTRRLTTIGADARARESRRTLTRILTRSNPNACGLGVAIRGLRGTGVLRNAAVRRAVALATVAAWAIAVEVGRFGGRRNADGIVVAVSAAIEAGVWRLTAAVGARAKMAIAKGACRTGAVICAGASVLACRLTDAIVLTARAPVDGVGAVIAIVAGSAVTSVRYATLAAILTSDRTAARRDEA